MYFCVYVAIKLNVLMKFIIVKFLNSSLAVSL